MNIQESDILNVLADAPYSNQRLLSENTGHSLGIVNRSLKNLQTQQYLDQDLTLTAKARNYLASSVPRRAVILAAGFGMRMAPIGMVGPKAMLEVKGEVLIERCLRQLHEAGIHDITVVVGFMK